jgi:Cdc6-like AAA superfamily ATPase
MIPKFDKMPYYPNENREYIASIKALVGMIFAGYDVGEVKYIKSDSTNFTNNRYKHLHAREQYASEIPEVCRDVIHPSPNDEGISNSFMSNTEQLGPLEKGFINYLLTCKQRGIILTGALGGGKTTLIQFASHYLITDKRHENCEFHSRCTKHSDIHIFFDFNKDLVDDTKPNLVVENFYSAFLTQLMSKVRELFMDNEVIEKFIAYCDAPTNQAKYFSCIKNVVEEHPLWSSLPLPVNDKFRHIQTWIKKEQGGNSVQCVSAYLEMLEIYRTLFYARKDQTCLMLIFDNIDVLSEEAQNKIIAVIAILNRQSQIKTIISSRLTTFHRIKAQHAFPFDIYENAGLDPVRLALRRMEHYLTNKKDSNGVYAAIRQHINATHLSAFDARMQFIYEQLTDRHYERLRKTLESLSGLGIRRGLRLCARLFDTYSILWGDTSPKENALIRCLYSYDFPNGLMKSDDHFITNLFLDPTSHCQTLMPLRILNALEIANQKNDVISKQDLIVHINVFKKEQDDVLKGEKEKEKEIDNIIWNLRSPEKRLLFIAGGGETEHEWLSKLDAALIITNAGQGYLSFICTNLQYIQNCFEIIDWKVTTTHAELNSASQYINENYNEKNGNKNLLLSSIDDIRKNSNDIHRLIPSSGDYTPYYKRMSFILKMLKFLFMQDMVEMINYKIASRQQGIKFRNIIGIDELITIPIIERVATATLHIAAENLKTEPTTFDHVRQEILDWKSFVVLAKEWNEFLFNKSKHLQLMEYLCDKYDAVIK